MPHHAAPMRIGRLHLSPELSRSGLYDPVLDESEYFNVPLELDDLDQETNIDQVKEVHFRSEELIDKAKSTTDFAIRVPETVIQPTVLKLNYKDVFPELNVEELPSEIKYRLPISEQYDPEGKRVTMFYEYNKHSFVDVEKIQYLANEYELSMQNKDFVTENQTNNRNVFKTQKLGANECNYFQINKDKTNLSEIEETASYVVDKNLNRAVSAANKIIKEIGTKSKSYEQFIQTEQIYNKHFYEDSKISGAENYITGTEKINRTETLSTEEIQKEVSVAEEIKKFESFDVRMDSKLSIEERKLLRQQDIEEAIDAGTVRQRTEIFKKEHGNRKFLENETFKIGACNKYTSNIQLSKQRAYNLGLQLIPHIRKATQLSKYGHFLFKIFLMQLTKVIIAISRFISLDDNKHLHEYSDSFIDRGEIIKKAKLSGAKIAQIEGFKPAELTNKMDIVLSEFMKKYEREENYFEKIISISKSRSRSNSKSNKEEEISNEFSFKPKTIRHKKETLQETYETKKNSIENRELKSEKRYSDFRTLQMDSKVNLYENDIKPVDDGNLIYIAIVEAHVYTNKDAIFAEQLKRMSENRYESESSLDKVYYRCEVSVTYRDFRESSLPPTVIIESIEEIPSEQLYEEEKQESQQTSVLGFEEIAKKLAVQKITEVLEPLLMIKEVKSVNIKHAYPAIEIPLKTTTETTTLAMEKENNIFQRTLLSEKLHSSIEEPVKSVVETSVLSVQEDESGLIDIFEFTQQTPHPTIESTAKYIAETTEFIEDEKVETIDCIQQVLQTPHPVVEGSLKSVAEITKIITDETKNNILNISKPLSVMPQYTITNNLKSVAETITTAEEAETDVLNILKSMSITPRCAISNNLLSIAETFTATTIEPNHENLDIAKVSKKVVGVGVHKNFATEVVEIFSEEPVPETIVILEIKETQSSEFFEKPLFILPETNTVLTEEPMSESLSIPETLMKEAKINIKLGDIPMCAEVTEITLNEKEQNTFDVMSSLEIEPLESKEKPVLSVVETTTVLPFEPKEEPLKIDELKIQDAHITIQKSQATEIAIVPSEEPQEANLNICKVNNKWPKIIMESSMLPVAEKLLVSLQEPDHEDLLIPNLDMKRSQKIIQDTGLPVAESLLVVPNGPESVDIIIPNTTNEQAKIIVEESKAPTTSEVYLEGPKSDNLELPIVEEKKIRLSIQDCTLTLVTKEEVMPESPIYDDLKLFKYEKDVGKVDIDECRAILTTITSYEEPKHENLEISRISEKQFKTLIETPLLTVAETSSVVLEPYNESFDTEVTDEKATVQFEEIQNCETTEITALEPKEKYFEVPIVKQQSLITSVGEVYLSTAESLLIIPEITTNTFDVRKTDKGQANMDVVENKSIETLVVHPLEPNYEKLEIYTLANKQPETLIEKPVLIVAETVTAVPEEICNNRFEMKTVEENAMINRVLFENYIITETTAEETIKKHEEVSVIHPQRLQTDIQRVHLLSAESSITIPQTYINSFETSKVENHQANINIVEQKGIESTLVRPFEPYYDELGISTVLKNQSETSVETPILTVAETLMDVTAESYDDSFATKISDEKATVNFVEIQNCGTTEITTEEQKENHFEVPIIKQQSLLTSMEAVHLSTAESLLIIPEITTNIFDARKIDKEQVKIDVVKNKSIETLLVSPLEPNYENLEISPVAKKQPETLIERPVLVVAETATALIEELCTNKFETKIVEDKAMVNRLLLEGCITTETTVEEPIKKHVEAPVISHQGLQTDIQRVHLSSAESSIIIPETYIHSFETSKIESHQANIHIVEQKGIEGSLVCPVEPYYEELEISTVLRNQPDALVETPILTVAETSMNVTAETYNYSFATKISDEKASVNFVEIQNCESTEITVEEPKEKHFEVPKIKKQRLVTSMEEVYLSTAESSLIIPKITTNTFDVRKTESYQAQKNIVEQKTIESTLVCPLEPYYAEFDISTVFRNQPDALVETPVLTVAEASTVTVAESCNDSYETKTTVEKATVNIVTMQNRETTETFIEEPKEKQLERTIIARQSLETSTEEAHLLTAESLFIIPGIDVNTFHETKSESQKVHVDIVEQKGIASFYVFPWEPHCDDIEIPKVVKKKVNSYIEKPLLIVAETITVVPVGNCDDKSDSKIRVEQALVHVVAIQNYIITETITEGPKEKNLEILVMDQHKLKTYIEELFLPVAEIITLIPELSITYFNANKTEIQQINVNMVEQKGIQTFLIFPFEPNIKNLEITKETAIQPETLIDCSFLNVAEIFRAMSEEPRYESFETKVTDVEATVSVIAIKTYDITEIVPEEPKEESLEISATNFLRLQSKMEDLNLSVAVLIFVVPEISVHTFDTKKTKSQQAHVNVIEQKSVEIFVQCLWAVNYEDLKMSRASSIQPDISIESPVLIGAEIFTTILEGPHIDDFEIKIVYEQAEVNIVAIRLPGIFQIIAEEPKETNFEIPTINKLKLTVVLEEVYSSLAESFLVLPDESIHSFKSRKMECQSVLIDVMEHKAIAISFVYVWEPNCEDLEVQEIIKKVGQTLIASSILTVAQNLTIVFEEKVQEGFKTIKTSAYQATTNFVKLKAAVKRVVFSEEPRQEIFEKSKLFMVEPQHSVVDKYLTVAEIQIMLPIEPKEKIFEKTEIISQYAHCEIEECKTAVSTIIFIEEPNIEEFITKGLITNESENLVEIIIKLIPQVTVINICEKEIEFSVPSQAVSKKVNIGFEALKPVAQKFLIFSEDSKHDVSECSKFISYHAKTTVIEAAATAVAQTTIANVSKHKSQKLAKSMERKHEVDISEIIDISHDVKNIDNVDITKYNVELAKDYEESFTTQRKKEIFSRDIDFASLSSVSTSSSISSAPSSPLIEVYVFGVKGHEYRVQSPQETSLDVISTHVDTGYKIENMDTSMTIAIEASIDKFEEMNIEREDVYDIDVKKRDFLTSDTEINESMESADVHMNKICSNMSLETEHNAFTSAKYQSFKDIGTSSTLITKNRALSYDQAADFEVGLQSAALKSKDTESSNTDSQELATFDFHSNATFESAKDVQSTEANLNIKMKSSKTMTAENIDVTYGLTIGNEIIDFDKSVDLSLLISHDSNTAKTGASKQISLEKSQLLSLEKTVSVKESYANHEEEMKAIYGIDHISTEKEKSISEKSFSAMKGNLESQSMSRKVSLEKSIRSIGMDTSAQANFIDIGTKISNDAQSPSPPVPSTPLIDYYMFKLQSPYPEETTFVPRDCSFSPESVDEDSLVTIDGLIPHIDTTIERILYSPPLQTPDTSPERQTEVMHTQSRLKGGALGQTKEEISDIGRKSLLALEIDKTIRSIEENKESVGISARKVEGTKRLDNLGIQKEEFSTDRQYMEARNASQVELSIANANGRFEGTSETKVKGLKRKTHKGLASSMSGEKTLAETHESRASSNQSGSIQSSAIESSSTQSSSIQYSDIKSSSSKSGSIKSRGIKSSSSKTDNIQSTGIESLDYKSTSIQSGSFLSSAIESSSSKSDTRKLSDSKHHSSNIIRSSGIASNGILASSSKWSSSQSSGLQLSAIQSSNIQSSGIKSSGVKSGDIQSSGIKSSSSSQSSGIISSGIQASSSLSSSTQSSAIQTSAIQSSDVQSSGIKSSSSKQLSVVKSNNIQSSSGQSSSGQSSSGKSSRIQSSSDKSSSIQSSSIQSGGIQARNTLSGNIQSSTFQSSDIQSSDIKSISSRSSSGKSSSSKSDQKLHLLSKFS